MISLRRFSAINYHNVTVAWLLYQSQDVSIGKEYIILRVYLKLYPEVQII